MPDIGASLSKPIGPLPVWGWGIVGVGGAGIFWYIHRSSSSSSGATSAVTPTADTSTAGIDPNQLAQDIAANLASYQTNTGGAGGGGQGGGGTATGGSTTNAPPTQTGTTTGTPPDLSSILSTIQTWITAHTPTTLPAPPVTPPTTTQPTGTTAGTTAVTNATNVVSQSAVDQTIAGILGGEATGVNWSPAVGSYQYAAPIGGYPGISFTPAPISQYQTIIDTLNADVNNPADVSFIATNYHGGNQTDAIHAIINEQYAQSTSVAPGGGYNIGGGTTGLPTTHVSTASAIAANPANFYPGTNTPTGANYVSVGSVAAAAQPQAAVHTSGGNVTVTGSHP